MARSSRGDRNVRPCRRARGTKVLGRNNAPGARSWETPEETEERKWIAYLMRCHPRALTPAEKLILNSLYAITDDLRRTTCGEIADEMGLGGHEAIHRIEAEALEKIGYDRRGSRPRRA